jgi:hypothetical protein
MGVPCDHFSARVALRFRQWRGAGPCCDMPNAYMILALLASMFATRASPAACALVAISSSVFSGSGSFLGRPRRFLRYGTALHGASGAGALRGKRNRPSPSKPPSICARASMASSRQYSSGDNLDMRARRLMRDKSSTVIFKVSVTYRLMRTM